MDVALLDLGILGQNWHEYDFTSWPTPGERGGESIELIRRDLQLALDALYERYGLDPSAETPAAEYGDAYWDDFLDDLFDVFSKFA